MTRWLSLLLLVCASTLGLAACGGDDSSSDSGDVNAVLKETFGAGKEVKSGQLGVSVRVNTKGLENVSGPLGLKLTGPFQSRGGTELPKFDFTAQLDLSGQSLRVGAVSTDDAGFVTVAGQAYALSDELYAQFKKGYADQAKCNEEGDEDAGVSFRTLGIDPNTWLREAKDAGEEEVGGAETTHITASIDVPAFLDDVNRILARTGGEQPEDPCADEPADGASDQDGGSQQQLSEKDRKAIADGVRSAKVDVWTGKEDRTLRRLNLKVAFEVPEASRKQLNGLSSGDITFDLSFAKLNEDQTIAAPKDARPLSELQGALGGAIPGLGGASGDSATPPSTTTPSGGGEGTSTTPSGGGTPYEQCVQAAGTDITKLQECASLIGQ